MDLADVMALPGPELLKVTFREIRRRDMRRRGYDV
jgi:hypothetical protein